MWTLEIDAKGATFVCYTPVLANEIQSERTRVIQLFGGPPSLGDIEKIQNYLNSYKGVPAGA